MARVGGDPVDAELGAVLERVAGRRRARGGAPRTGGREPGPPVGASAGPGVVAAVRHLGDDIVVLRVGRPAGFAHRAGQYLKLGLPGTRSGSFSIASPPHDPLLELCIERIPEGRLTPSLFTLRPGDHVVVSPRPKGSLALDERAGHHLLVATGTGIAPIRAMVLDAVHRGTGGAITVLHGASFVDHLAYADELAALAAATPRFTYVPTISRPEHARNAGWAGARGRVDPLALRHAAALDPAATQLCACGNSGMIAAVVEGARPGGFRVSTEAFD